MKGREGLEELMQDSVRCVKGGETLQTGLLVWLLFINAVGYLVMSEDKKRARKHRDRVPERTLFLLALIGGALGVLIAMYRKRHKTRHMSFRLGIPALLFVNALLYGYFLR
jgi:uncharacterized membrane protein YsdA (DUF1294 family)